MTKWSHVNGPAVVDVGRALLVVAVGLGHGHEAVPFVEAAGAGVRLEGPQVEARRAAGPSRGRAARSRCPARSARARGTGGRPTRRGARAARRSRRPPRPPTSRMFGSTVVAKWWRTSSSGCTDGGMAGTDACRDRRYRSATASSVVGSGRPDVHHPILRRKWSPWQPVSPQEPMVGLVAEGDERQPVAVDVGAGPRRRRPGRRSGTRPDRGGRGWRRATRSAPRPTAGRAARPARAARRDRGRPTRPGRRRSASSPRPGAAGAGSCRPAAAVASRCRPNPGAPGRPPLRSARRTPPRRPARARSAARSRARRVASERIRPSWTAMSVAGSAGSIPLSTSRDARSAAAASASRSRVPARSVRSPAEAARRSRRAARSVRAASRSPCRRTSASVRRAALKRTAWARISASRPSASEGSSRPTSSFHATSAAVRSRAASSSSRVIDLHLLRRLGVGGVAEPAQVQPEVARRRRPGPARGARSSTPGRGRCAAR